MLLSKAARIFKADSQVKKVTIGAQRNNFLGNARQMKFGSSNKRVNIIELQQVHEQSFANQAYFTGMFMLIAGGYYMKKRNSQP